MRIWYFSEMAYHPAWEEGKKAGSFRVDFPNHQLDPKIAHGLLNRYMDEYCLADELGLSFFGVGEHHLDCRFTRQNSRQHHFGFQ